MTVCFELTKDPEILQRYYNIREDCYRRELGVRSFNGGEDEFDRTGHILVAHSGDRCIGGVRLSGSTSEFPALLPMEKSGLLLLKEFPQLADTGKGYCQLGRLALEPEFRTTDTLLQMTEAIIREAKSLGYSYTLLISGLNRSRLYRRLYNTVGYNYDILMDLKIPEEQGFKGLEHLLSIGYLDQARTELDFVEDFEEQRIVTPLHLRRVA